MKNHISLNEKNFRLFVILMINLQRKQFVLQKRYKAKFNIRIVAKLLTYTPLGYGYRYSSTICILI